MPRLVDVVGESAAGVAGRAYGRVPAVVRDAAERATPLERQLPGAIGPASTRADAFDGSPLRP